MSLWSPGAALAAACTLAPGLSAQTAASPITAAVAESTTTVSMCLGVVAGYLVWSARKGGDFTLWRWELPRPSFRRALAQIGVSFADWVLSGAALYVLLPHRVPFHVFFAVFLLGQFAGLVAQVPAGLGVFEAVMLWGLTPALPTASVLIGLVAYRLVYFFLPLTLAAAIWAVREGRRWFQRRRTAVRAPA